MSRNGSGVYSLPAGNPVVTNTTISSTWANTTLTNIASALTDSLAADGQTTATGNLKMGANRITGLAEPIASTDAATKGYVDTADAVLTAAIAAVASVPTGSITMWPTGTAPTGYLLCAGAAVSRTTYAALFAIVGTTFGVGDGSTTFNLPNYTNRMPYGTTVGTTGGSADAVVVSHNHSATSTVADPGHFHTTTLENTTGSGGTPGAKWSALTAVTQTSSANTDTKTTGITVATTTASAGVSGTNANLPPYLGISFIIKI
jgi:microcystin-dependent protein